MPLFNGKNLDGWVNVNCAPDTFTVADGRIASTGVPTGILRSDRQYENFELELEWMHLRPLGNAGLFVWSQPVTAPGTPFAQAIEVQILDGRNSENYTSHGDVFAIHGADMTPDRPHPNGWNRCLPSEQRAKPAGEWNHYRVVCNGGRVELAVNGKVVSGASNCTPRHGYICLESEGSPALFRNIRIRELPSSGATAAQRARHAEAFRPLYTGVDLAGWKHDAGHAGHWEPTDWRLVYDGKSAADEKSLWSERDYGDVRVICDWRLPRDSGESAGPWTLPVDVRRGVMPVDGFELAPGEWHRSEIAMRGDVLSVDIDGARVIDGTKRPGVAERGPILLQHRDGPVELASVLVKELGVYQSERFVLSPVDGQEVEGRYRLLEPDFVEPGVEYPLVVFLHGAGERGTDNAKQLQYLPTALASREKRDRFPCYVIAPQCDPEKRWAEIDRSSKKSVPLAAEPSTMMRVAIGAIQRTLARHPIDRRRVYLTGLSMGGYGSWDLAARHSQLFAAAVPICGGGDEAQAPRLAKLPIWAFHGDADAVVPPERSRTMVAAIRAAGGEPRYSELPGVGHDSWKTAYRDESGLLDWLFAQRRDEPGVW